MPLSSVDLAAPPAAEQALVESFEAPDPTAWVDFYTGSTTRVRFLILWRGEGDGRWRLARELVNADV